MATELAALKPGWLALLHGHASQHVPAALGLGLELLGVLALLIQSLAQVAGGNAPRGLLMMVLDTALG